MKRRFALRLLLAACNLAGASQAAVGPSPEPPPGAPAPAIELRTLSLADQPQLPMHHWHHRYRGLITPVVHAWTELARATRQPWPARSMATGCRGLESALVAVDRQAVLSAPDTAVALHLAETLRSLGRASRSCTRGAYFLTAWRLRQAEGSWAELGRRLQLYGLSP